MFRGKKVGVIVLFMGLALFLTGCGKSNASDTYQDDNFMSALESGLHARWKITEASNDDSKDDYQKYISAELKEVSSFRNKKFKSAKLQEAALNYISSLNDQKASLKYFGADESDDKWAAAYDKRTEAILAINKIKKIKVSSDDQKHLDELLGNGKAVGEKSDKDAKIDALLRTIKFTAQPKEYAEDTYTTYNAEVVNNTGFDIKSFSANVKIKDASGTTVDTPQINTENWSDGDKVKFDFSTDQEVSSYEVIKDYIEY